MGRNSSRRFLGPIPSLTRRAWEDISSDLDRFLRRFREAWDDGIPPGFNDTTPEDVEVGGESAGSQSEGWAAADHVHSASVAAPVEVGVELAAEEGTASSLSRSDHRHGVIAYRTVGLTVDGSTDVIATGVKGYIAVPFTGTIIGWQIVSSRVGSAVVDAWKDRRKPDSGDSICGAAKPTLTTALSATGDTTGWTTTSVQVGDVFAFNVDSTDLTLFTLTLKVQESALGF